MGRTAVVNADVPLLVCVSADVGVREQVVRRLEDCGAVLMCADLDELRAMLFPPPNGAVPPHAGAGASGSASGSGARPDGAPVVAARGGEGVVVVGDLIVDVDGHLVTWR